MITETSASSSGVGEMSAVSDSEPLLTQYP
jgi:hypothetical protein